MNFKQIESFLWVADLKSFTKAARHLYMSQPAVSFQIKALEEDLSVVLFKRGEKKMVLTDAGQLLYKEAKQILQHYQKMKVDLDDLKGLKTGQLTVGANSIPGEYVLPHLIGNFFKSYPGVKINLRIADSRQVAQMITSREIDVGFTGMPAEGNDVVCFPWLKDELQLIVPISHKWAGLDCVEAADLINENFIFRERGSGTRQTVEELLSAKVPVDQIPKWLELGSSRAVITAVETGLGVSIVSRYAAKEAVEAGRVKVTGIADLELCRSIYQLQHKQSAGSFVMKTFIDHINDAAICRQFGIISQVG